MDSLWELLWGSKTLRKHFEQELCQGEGRFITANEIVLGIVSPGRLHPGPPKNTKTTFGWFFHLLV